MLDVIRKHILSFRVLPNVDALKSAGITYVDTDQPPEYYIGELKKRAIYHAYIDFQKKVQPHISTTIDTDLMCGLIDDFQKRVANLGITDKFKSISELGKEIQDQIEQRKNGSPEVYVPFGWPSLDRVTAGLGGGDLAYFIARPGKGKSQLITYMAHHAWTQGFSPLVLTMEMTDIQISRRMFGIKGSFNHDALRRGIPDSHVEDKLAEAIDSFEKGPAFNFVCGQVRQTVESITSLVDELKPDILYIDAAYLINMSGSQAKAWEKIALIGERLKELAITRNIPIVMTVQFNREAAKKNKDGKTNLDLENIAGSDAIGQLGSVIVSVDNAESPYADTRRHLAVIKNREGGIVEFDINFLFDTADFNEVLAGKETTTEYEFVA